MAEKASPKPCFEIGLGWSKKVVVAETAQSRTYHISPARKITFRRSRTAIEFERLRKKYDGDEFQAWSELRLKYRYLNEVVAPQQYDISELPYDLGNTSKSAKQVTTLKHVVVRTKQASTLPDCTNSATKRCPKHLKHSSAGSKSVQILPFRSWLKKSYVVKGRKVLLRQTPKHGVVFKSEKSALSFDIVLKAYQGNETKALDNFLKGIGGIGKFRNMVQNMGTYKLQQSYQAQLQTPAKAQRSPKSSPKAKQVTATISVPSMPAKKRNHPASGTSKCTTLAPAKVSRPSIEQATQRLRSKGWEPGEHYYTTRKGYKQFLWVSPELRIKFLYRNGAEEFQQWCEKYKVEETAWVHFSEEKLKNGVALSSIIRGGAQSLSKIVSLSKLNPGTCHKGKSLATAAMMNRASEKASKSREIGHGWSQRKVVEAKQPRTYHISPARKITFKRPRTAIEFERLRKKYDGDEFQAWSELRLKYRYLNEVVAPQQYDISELPYDLGNTSKSAKQVTTLKHVVVRTKQASTLPDCTNSATKRCPKHLKHSSAGSKSVQILPFRSWLKKSYVVKGRKVLLRQTPKHGVVFKSEKSALSFDIVLKAYQGNETKALDNFLKGIGGIGKFRNMVQNMGTYKLQQSYQAQLQTPAKAQRSPKSSPKAKQVTATISVPSMPAKKRNHPASGTSKCTTLASAKVSRPSIEQATQRLFSKGWETGEHYRTTRKGTKQFLWVSPELRIKFLYRNGAEEFQQWCEKYKVEETAWVHFSEEKLKHGVRLSSIIQGGGQSLSKIVPLARLGPGTCRKGKSLVTAAATSKSDCASTIKDYKEKTPPPDSQVAYKGTESWLRKLGWKTMRETLQWHANTDWLSPGNSYRFKSQHAAEEFEHVYQMMGGDINVRGSEKEAWEQFKREQNRKGVDLSLVAYPERKRKAVVVIPERNMCIKKQRMAAHAPSTDNWAANHIAYLDSLE